MEVEGAHPGDPDLSPGPAPDHHEDQEVLLRIPQSEETDHTVAPSLVQPRDRSLDLARLTGTGLAPGRNGRGAASGLD